MYIHTNISKYVCLHVVEMAWPGLAWGGGGGGGAADVYGGAVFFFCCMLLCHISLKWHTKQVCTHTFNIHTYSTYTYTYLPI